MLVELAFVAYASVSLLSFSKVVSMLKVIKLEPTFWYRILVVNLLLQTVAKEIIHLTYTLYWERNQLGA